MRWLVIGLTIQKNSGNGTLYINKAEGRGF